MAELPDRILSTICRFRLVRCRLLCLLHDSQAVSCSSQSHSCVALHLCAPSLPRCWLSDGVIVVQHTVGHGVV